MNTLKHALIYSALLAMVSCSKNLAPVGHYQSTPVVADGNASDWELPLRFSNKDYTVSYNFTTDKKNVYLIVISKDEAMEQRILKSGITVYFDPKGETNKKISLTFPEHKSGRGARATHNSDSVTTTSMMIPQSADLNMLVYKSDTYDAEGFFNLENGQYGIKDKRSKIQIGLSVSADNGLVYEAIVPINYLLADGLTAKNLKKNFSAGIVIHSDVTAPKRNTNTGSNNSGMSPRISMGGMGGMGMGRMGMGMGMGGGSRGYRNTNNQQTETKPADEPLWYQFRFTDKPASN
jgi:hypothetical protein